jgi:hypothetical protein
MITIKTVIFTAFMAHKAYLAVTNKSVLIDWETFFKDGVM